MKNAFEKVIDFGISFLHDLHKTNALYCWKAMSGAPVTLRYISKKYPICILANTWGLNLAVVKLTTVQVTKLPL
jgi:hypothetical protein